jgi:predicted membrane channel-forming protein YqfA (hemolysin III family)
MGATTCSPRPRYWLTRLYIALSVLAMNLATYLEPGALAAPCTTGWVLAGILCGLGLIGVLDVIINDLMPDRFTLPAVKEHRHLVYVGMALATLGMAYAIVRAEGWTSMLIVYGVDFAAALAVAPLDLFARHRRHP